MHQLYFSFGVSLEIYWECFQNSFDILFNVHILNLLYIYASDTVKIFHIKNYNNLQVIVSFGMKFDEENNFNLDFSDFTGKECERGEMCK